MISRILKNRFVYRPIKLSSAVSHFFGMENTFKMYALVKEFLPEQYEKLLTHSAQAAAKEFVKQFNKRHFKLYWDDSYWPQDLTAMLTNDIPAKFLGFRHYNYEPNPYSQKLPSSQLLAEVICEPPFDGAYKIPVLAEFQKIVGEVEAKPLLEMLAQEDCMLPDVEEALKDSEWPGFLTWCQWIHGATGNAWLDSDDRLAWSRTNVDKLTRDYKPYLKLYEEMQGFEKWLKKDFKKNSAQIITYVAHKININHSKLLIKVFA